MNPTGPPVNYGAPIWQGINDTYRGALENIIQHDTERGCLQEPWLNFEDLGQATHGTYRCVQTEVQTQWIDLAVDAPDRCAVPVLYT